MYVWKRTAVDLTYIQYIHTLLKYIHMNTTNYLKVLKVSLLGRQYHRFPRKQSACHDLETYIHTHIHTYIHIKDGHVYIINL